jgi:DNA-binding FadR family transcriptional regulator
MGDAGKGVALKPVDAAGFASARSEKSSERVYESLMHAIVTGKLVRGSKLPSELALAGRFDVSRPVLREALGRLRSQGLIASVRGSGNYVSERPAACAAAAAAEEDDPSAPALMARVGHVLTGLEFRLIVEPEAAFMAASRRGPDDLIEMRTALDGYEAAIAAGEIAHHFDYRFHAAIAVATANPRIVAALQSLEHDVSHSVDLMRHFSHFEPIERSRHVTSEHREILSRIEDGDAEGARRVMRNHIEHARIRMLNSRTDT